MSTDAIVAALPTISATVQRPSIDTKIGIDFATRDNNLYVAFVEGLSAETSLSVGAMMIDVNGMHCTQMSPDECKTFIRSIIGAVSIRTTDGAAIFGEGVTTRGPYRFCVSTSVPELLKGAGVSDAKWGMLVNAVQQQLLPATQEAIKFHKVEFDNVPKRTAMAKIQMAASNAHSNASLVASNVLALAATLLAPHGILAQLIIETLRPYPSGACGGTRNFIDVDFTSPSSNMYFRDVKFSVPTGLEFSKVD